MADHTDMLVLVGRIGGVTVGIPAAEIAAVVPAVKLEEPAGRVPRVIGYLRYRGERIPVLCLQVGRTAAPENRPLSTRLVLLARAGATRPAAALIVDGATGTKVVSTDEAQLVHPDQIGSLDAGKNGSTILLDTKVLLAELDRHSG